jgi:hypothetical protein
MTNLDADLRSIVANGAPAFAVGYRIRRALAARNRGLSDFWRGREHPRPAPALAGRHLLMVDAEDDVAASTGLAVRVQRFDRDLPSGSSWAFRSPVTRSVL